MNKSPAFQFYPKDFLLDDKVAVMTLEQMGAYIKLLCYCWNNDGLPNDTDELKGMCGNPKNWDKIWDRLSKCFYEKKGKLQNKRLSIEKKKQNEWKKMKSESGKKGAEIRWGKQSKDNNLNGTPNGQALAKDSSSFSSSSSTSVISKSIISITFNFDTEKWENIIEKDKERWKKTYPACDVDRELLFMADWLIADPKRKKINYKKFITNWLKNNQDRGGTKKAKQSSSLSKKEREWQETKRKILSKGEDNE